jgi:predicted transcriptional regulator
VAKKSGTIDQEQTQNNTKQASREEIDAALERLEKIAETLPPVDAVEIVREGRDVGSL